MEATQVHGITRRDIAVVDNLQIECRAPKYAGVEFRGIGDTTGEIVVDGYIYRIASSDYLRIEQDYLNHVG